MNPSRLLSHPLFTPFAIQLILAYEWLSAGWEKVYGGQLVPTIEKTLGRFENGNPHGWYVGSMLEITKSHPVAFSMLVQWGELLAGIGLAAALVLYGFSKQPFSKEIARFIAIAALLGGMCMNSNFYFAAGWTSPSTGGLNALMFWIEIVLFVTWMALLRNQRKTTDRMSS